MSLDNQEVQQKKIASSDLVRKKLAYVAHRVEASELKGHWPVTDGTLSTNNEGCKTILDEDQCIHSRDGRVDSPAGYSPCHWCCGRACTSSGHACESLYDLLQHGDGNTRSRNGLGDDTCEGLNYAEQGCSVFGTESACKSMMDGRRGPMYGSPCEWCCGRKCTPTSSLCEPRAWLVAQPEYLGRSSNGLSGDVCAEACSMTPPLSGMSPGSNIGEQSFESGVQCEQACLMQPQCFAIVYRAHAKSCFLLDRTYGEQFAPAPSSADTVVSDKICGSSVHGSISIIGMQTLFCSAIFVVLLSVICCIAHTKRRRLFGGHSRWLLASRTHESREYSRLCTDEQSCAEEHKISKPRPSSLEERLIVLQQEQDAKTQTTPGFCSGERRAEHWRSWSAFCTRPPCRACAVILWRLTLLLPMFADSLVCTRLWSSRRDVANPILILLTAPYILLSCLSALAFCRQKSAYKCFWAFYSLPYVIYSELLLFSVFLVQDPVDMARYQQLKLRELCQLVECIPQLFVLLFLWVLKSTGNFAILDGWIMVLSTFAAISVVCIRVWSIHTAAKLHTRGNAKALLLRMAKLDRRLAPPELLHEIHTRPFVVVPFWFDSVDLKEPLMSIGRAIRASPVLEEITFLNANWLEALCIDTPEGKLRQEVIAKSLLTPMIANRRRLRRIRFECHLPATIAADIQKGLEGHPTIDLVEHQGNALLSWPDPAGAPEQAAERAALRGDLPVLLAEMIAVVKSRPNVRDWSQTKLLESLLLTATSGTAAMPTIEALLYLGADVTVATINGTTALMLASESGHTEAVDLMLRASAGVDAIDEEGNTALIFACAGGHAKTAEHLLSHGAGVEIKNKAGECALILASVLGFFDVVELVLGTHADIGTCDSAGQTALIAASSGGHTDVVKRLLAAGALVNVATHAGHTPLILASREGHSETLGYLLEVRGQVDAVTREAWTALMFASAGGHLVIVDMLLRSRASVNLQTSEGCTALMRSSGAGHPLVVKRLLQHQASVEIAAKDGGTALMRASAKGHADCAEELLAFGARAAVQALDGGTALMCAGAGGHMEIATMLIEARADVNAVTNDGGTALLIASYSAQPDVVEMLLRASGAPTACTSAGYTALMLATLSGHVETVKRLLVASIVPINAKGTDGRTALVIAKHQGYAEIQSILLAAGAKS